MRYNMRITFEFKLADGFFFSSKRHVYPEVSHKTQSGSSQSKHVTVAGYGDKLFTAFTHGMADGKRCDFGDFSINSACKFIEDYKFSAKTKARATSTRIFYPCSN